LRPIYENKKRLAYAFYNDETPSGKTTSSGAHAKGVIATDGENGFWLIHSIPKYPAFTAPFTWQSLYSRASDIFGQSFLCISMDAKDLDAMAKQVILMQPQVFASNMPSTLASKYPNLATLVAGKSKHRRKGESSIVDFKSSGGRSFRSFAKNPSWGEDLYADLVQPDLKINMLVETWRRHKGGCLPSYCAGSDGREYNTLNVETIVFPTNNFKYTQDHSKWGISADEKSPYVCVGGINRMEVRGFPF
jgi:deoxyribonuclease-2